MINNSQNISSSSTSVKKAEVDSQYLEVKSCNKTTLNAIPVNNGDFYHTTDTNEFFYDWNNKRIQLDLFGTGSVDYLKGYVREGDKISILINDKEYINKNDLGKYLVDNGYDTKDNIKDEIKEELGNSNDIARLDKRLDAAKAEIINVREELKKKSEITAVSVTNIINNVSTINTNLSGKITALSKKVDALSVLSGVPDSISKISKVVNSLEEKVETNKSDIETDIKDIIESVSVGQIAIDNLSGRISKLGNLVTACSNKINKLSTLSSVPADIEKKINALQVEISKHKKEVSDDIQSVEDSFSDVYSVLSGCKTADAKLNSRLDYLESILGNNRAEINTLSSLTMSSLTSLRNITAGSIKTIESKFDGIITELSKKIVTMSASLSSYKKTCDSHNNYLNSRLDDLEVKLNNKFIWVVDNTEDVED